MVDRIRTGFGPGAVPLGEHPPAKGNQSPRAVREEARGFFR